MLEACEWRREVNWESVEEEPAPPWFRLFSVNINISKGEISDYWWLTLKMCKYERSLFII